MVFHWRIKHNRNRTLKFSHLCYADKTYIQYQATVKLLGSFRLSAGSRHLHRHCIFTEPHPETVLQSLRHSCTSELTRQGIALYMLRLSCDRGTASLLGSRSHLRVRTISSQNFREKVVVSSVQSLRGRRWGDFPAAHLKFQFLNLVLRLYSI